MNLQEQERFYQAFTRSRAASSQSQNQNQAPVITTPSQMIVSDNPDRIRTSKGASSSTQYETVVKKYDMSLPSTGDQVYKCGLHDYETNSLTEFNRHVEDHSSKAASVLVPTNKLKVIHDFIRSNGRI
jgi:hypothetical protein